MDPRAAIDLYELFRTELQRCRVKPGERVILFTDPLFPFPAYASAGLAATVGLGADGFVMTVPSWAALGAAASAVWSSADLIVGMSTIPWLRTEAHERALANGARSLMVSEPPSSLRRMAPSDDVIARGRAGAQALREANELRLVDKIGTDLTMHKDGRKGHTQYGVADAPGRWDHWPSGLVACTPLEESASGVLVAQPGDVLFRRHLTSAVTISLAEGRITRIEGGHEAVLLREYLDSFDDPEASRLSHVGWGIDRRADWNFFSTGREPTAPCPDQEGKFGTITVALGQNAFDTPDPTSGLGGTNRTAAHIDLSFRGKDLFLDGRQVIDRERIVIPELN